MTKLQEMSENFKYQYEKFLNGCDALEDKKDWDVSVNGDMETYYFNDIMCVIVLLISADGKFAGGEAKYINDIFGFSYTPEELRELYRTNGEDIQNMLEAEVPAGYRRMKLINSKLAEHYRQLIFLICDIIAESDGYIQDAELKQIERVKAGFAD